MNYNNIKYIKAPEDMLFLGLVSIKLYILSKCKHLKKTYRIIFRCRNGIDMFKWDGSGLSNTTQLEFKEALRIKKILI